MELNSENIRAVLAAETKPNQCRAARALLGWTQPQLAEAAGLGLSTIVDFEKERRALSDVSVTAITNALETAGVEFIYENGGGPGVRIKGERNGRSDNPS